MPRLITMVEWDYLQEFRRISDNASKIKRMIKSEKDFIERQKETLNPYEKAMLEYATDCLSRASKALEIALDNWREI